MTTSLLQATIADSKGFDLSLWVIGLLCSFIGALLLILLTRVLKQGDDTNKKIDIVAGVQGEQGIAIAEIKTTLHGANGLAAKVDRLHEDRNRQQTMSLEREVDDNRRLRQQLRDLGHAEG